MRSYVRLSLFCCIGLASQAVNAASWQFEPRLSVGASHESQPNYNVTYKPLNTAFMRFRAEVARATELNRLAVVLDAYEEDSAHQQRRERDRHKVQLSYQRSWQRQRFNILANYEESSVNADFDDQGLGVLLERDIGRYRTDLNTSWLAIINEKNSLNISLNLNKLSYQFEPTELNDSWYYIANITWNQQLSSRFSHALSASRLAAFTRFDAVQAYRVSDANGASIVLFERFERDSQSLNDNVRWQLSYSLSERAQWNIEIGYRNSQSFGQRLMDDALTIGQRPTLTSKNQRLNQSAGRTLGLDYRYLGLRSEFKLRLENQILPSTNAGILERDNFSVIYSYYITQPLKAFMDTSINRQENTLKSTQLEYQKRDYYRLKLGLDWQAGEFFGFNLSVEQRRQRDDQADFLSNNIYRLSWWYRPQQQRW